MALSDLTQKITDDAALHVARITEEREATLATIRTQQDARESALRTNAAHQLEAALAHAQTRARETAEREAHLLIERAKRTLLDETFASAVAQLQTLDDAAFVAILRPHLAALPSDLPYTVYVQPTRLAAVTAALTTLGRTVPVVADDTVQSGFVARGDTHEWSATFQQLVEEIRHTSEVDVARILFGEL